MKNRNHEKKNASTKNRDPPQGERVKKADTRFVMSDPETPFPQI